MTCDAIICLEYCSSVEDVCLCVIQCDFHKGYVFFVLFVMFCICVFS